MYNNGTHHLVVGITSYVVGSCGTLGVVDGFAKVSHQLDWIRANSDNYVKFCSAKIHQGTNSIISHTNIEIALLAGCKIHFFYIFIPIFYW